MQKTIHDGDIVTFNGRDYRVNFEQDDDHGAPWEDCDGHGIVSEWTTRDKRPGERVLNSDGRSKRFYDVQATMQLAQQECWSLSDKEMAELLEKLARPRIVRRVVESRYHVENGIRKDYITEWKTVTIPGRDPAKPLTRGEIVAAAVDADYEFLRSWCNDEWHHCGIVVTHIPHGMEPGEVENDYGHAVWGFADNDYEYLTREAHSIIAQCERDIIRQREETREALRGIKAKIRELIRDLRESAALRPAICDAVRGQLERLLQSRASMQETLFSLAGDKA